MDKFKLEAVMNPYEHTGQKSGGTIGRYAPQQAKVQQKGLTKTGLAGTPPNLANINCELTPVHKGGDLGNIIDFSW